MSSLAQIKNRSQYSKAVH